MRWDSEHAGAALAAGTFGLLVANAALADGTVDPSYGRIAGDASWVIGGGAAVGPRGARATAELRMRYLDTAGLFATYEDALSPSTGSEPRRVMSGGLELRPVFLYRWLRGLETNRGYLDLAIDSLGLELGAVLAASGASPSDFRPGLEVGLGIEVPFWPAAAGPWLALHGGIRWGDRSLALGLARDPNDRAAYLTITLAWHQVVDAHLVR